MRSIKEGEVLPNQSLVAMKRSGWDSNPQGCYALRR